MRVMIIGLDGASLDLVLPWMRAGHLPAFSRLVAGGGYGALESVPNMRSAAAWTTLQTGKNPGKHGILEFYERIPNTYDIRFVNALSRQGASFFKIASDAGRRVVAVNVPMSFPAEHLNGVQIAGLDAPGKKSPGFCWPPELLQDLESAVGEYIIEPGLTGCIVNGQLDKAVELLFKEIESKKRASRYLMARHPWDLLVTIFRSTDAAHHCFWKYQDSGHPQHNPADADKYGDVIRQAYQQIDAFVAEALEHADPDTLVLVVSDHGCGPKHPASNQLNRWLESAGFLAYRRAGADSGNPLTRALGGIYRWTIAKTPRRTKEFLWRVLPGFRDRVQSRLCFAGIDWGHTRAFSDTLFPTIWINVKGREPLGVVEAGEEYDRVCAEVTEVLMACRDEASGEPIVDRVLHRRDIYSGPHVDKAPDLLVRWREDIPIRGIRLPTQAAAGGKPGDARRGTTPFIPGEDYRVISGDHRLKGLLMFRNPAVKHPGQQRLEAALQDIAPTALYALGLPVPEDMDGRVLTELFDDAYLREHPVSYCKPDSCEETARPGDKDYGDEEEETVKERLRSLGYLE
jgi:predicted AlkP superfamily phosphohydrolase/phosphomutase